MQYPPAATPPTSPGSCTAASAARHAQLLLFVEAALADPSLSPAKVAAANGLSVRQLHRLFRESGRSFGQHLRQRRLERCRDDLADPRLRALPVTEIAYRWGFNCSSHFARSFRAAFGLSASCYRHSTADSE